MDDITSGALVSDPETRRALQLDVLSRDPADGPARTASPISSPTTTSRR